MSEPTPLTLRELRELARKHLGRGHSRLKTKDELVDALKKAVPEVMAKHGSAAQPSVPLKPVVIAALPEAKPSAPPQRVAAKAQPPAVAVVEAKPTPPAKVEAQMEVPVSAPRVERPMAEPAAEVVTEGFFSRPVEPRSDPVAHEPLIEGFFVARIAGRREARRHGLTGALKARDGRLEEDLGELPASYGEESAVLLARDPTTVFFFWDFNPATRTIAGAVQLLLRVYEGGRVVREQLFPLEAKSFYVPGLSPGHTYRIEAFVRASDGKVSPLRIATNPVTLPSHSASTDLSVRMLRVPWSASLSSSQVARRTPAGHLELAETPALPSSMTGRRAPGVPEHLPEGVSGEHLPSSQTGRRMPPVPEHLSEGVSGEHLPSSLSRRGAPQALPPHLSEGVAGEHVSSSPYTRNARPEEIPPPLDLPPHLELPSSHIFRTERGQPSSWTSSRGNKK